MCFQSEVPSVDQMQLRIWQVTLVGLRAIDDEDLVVLAPNDERRRLMGAEIRLPLRIERNIGAVVVEEIELDFLVAGPIEACLVHRPRIRADKRRIRHTVCVLPLRP